MRALINKKLHFLKILKRIFSYFNKQGLSKEKPETSELFAAESLKYFMRDPHEPE